MTDVVTTVGVVIGIGLVALTKWERLDPIIALLVAANILFTGFRLLHRSALGLMDVSLPAGDVKAIKDTLNNYEAQGVEFHGVRTRNAAARGFMSMHVLVPGNWTVQQSHALAEKIESDIRAKLPSVAIVSHVEPLEDPISMADKGIDQE